MSKSHMCTIYLILYEFIWICPSPICATYLPHMCHICAPYMCPICATYVPHIVCFAKCTFSQSDSPIPHIWYICATYVPHMCYICATYVPHMCPIYVPHMCHICAPYVPHMCHICATYVQHMCHICATYVPHMPNMSPQFAKCTFSQVILHFLSFGRANSYKSHICSTYGARANYI